jgi:UDP-galactopyranose mutase
MKNHSLINSAEVLVVGAGLCGASIARTLAEKGLKVIIWERREHSGGNMYDYVDNHGILVHKYGPHTFHTNDKRLYDFMARFGEWDEYHLWCGAEIDGQYTPTPFNFATIDTYYPIEKAEQIKQKIKEKYKGRETFTVLEALECDIPEIREYAEFLFAKDYSLYTAKQWGLNPSEIDPSVLRRVPLRSSYKEGYFEDTYQVMPHTTYCDFFKNLFDHPNIKVEQGIEALDYISIDNESGQLLIDGEKKDLTVVYTGALDELFGCCYGSLPYRSLKFEWKYEKIESFQNAPVVAYPQAEGFTRITEYKKLPEQKVQGTSYAVEYSLEYKRGENEPYYPVITEQSKELYARYQARADKINGLYYCGRLADFKYYNMDQALARALDIADKIKT